METDNCIKETGGKVHLTKDLIHPIILLQTL
jgi:hypothetical protein